VTPICPKILTASKRYQEIDFIAPWFLTYKFCPANGNSTIVRIRNTSLESLTFWQYWKELFWFRRKGKVVNTGPYNSNDYEIKKRSQGPH
jgi:hypothetical protein